MRGEGLRGREHDLGPIGDEFAPAIAAWVADGSRHQAKRAAAGIGADVENATGTVAGQAGMMVSVVFVIVFARGNEAEVGIGLSGGKEADLAGGVAGDGEEEKGAAAGALDIEAKALVALFVEQSIELGCAEDVAVEAVGALGGFVFDGIEERAIVGGPGGAGDALDSNGESLAGGQILDLQRVLAEAGGVERVGEQGIVVADGEGAEAEKGVACS